MLHSKKWQQKMLVLALGFPQKHTFSKHWKTTGLPKANMTMENPPVEDVFPIENGDFPMSC